MVKFGINGDFNVFLSTIIIFHEIKQERKRNEDDTNHKPN